MFKLIDVKSGVVYTSDSKTVIIGRGEGVDISLDYPTVSMQHAEVVVTGDGKAVIKDLNSTNGIRVNSVFVRDSNLRDGVVLHIGDAEFVVEMPNEQTRGLIGGDTELKTGNGKLNNSVIAGIAAGLLVVVTVAVLIFIKFFSVR
ncbi:MAG: FHA domain-containing protein [Elusimicrobiota bacterium]